MVGKVDRRLGLEGISVVIEELIDFAMSRAYLDRDIELAV